MTTITFKSERLPLVSLKDLNVSSNLLKTIQGLDLLAELECFDASQNQIEELSGLDGCPLLRTLNLAQNKIRRVQNLAVNSALDVSVN